MDDELLTEILAVEREVSERLNRLETESARMLEALDRELTAGIERELCLFQEESDRVNAAAEQEARMAANAIVADAKYYAARIGSISDEKLKLILARHLVRLRPEAENDRQDEQN